jgi:hypothetical protein
LSDKIEFTHHYCIKLLKEKNIPCDGTRLMPAALSEIFEKLGHPDWSKKFDPALAIVKPCYTRTELAVLYQMNRSTFFKRCKRAGLTLRSGRLPPKEAMRVFDCFGIPTPP